MSIERDAQFWRELEKDTRALAAEMIDADAKRMMLFIAEGYKLLAKADRHQDDGRPPRSAPVARQIRRTSNGGSARMGL